jgi:hypothetical protein
MARFSANEFKDALARPCARRHDNNLDLLVDVLSMLDVLIARSEPQR